MKKITVFLFVVICFTSCVGVKKYNTQISSLHSVSELHEDADKAYSQLTRLHPKLYQFISKDELDAKFLILKNSIDHPMGSKEFYERLAVFTKEVRQGHLKIRPPNQRFTKPELKYLKNRKFEFSDLDFEILEEKLWIKSTMGKDSSLVGNEVLVVDRESTKKLIAKYKSLFNSDGFNTTLHDRHVGYNFSGFYYSDKGYRDSLTLLLKNNDSIYFRTFRRVKKNQLLKDSSVIKKPIELSNEERLTHKARQKAKNKAKKKAAKIRGYLPNRDIYLRNFDFIGADSSVAYLKIRGFGDGNQKKFYSEVFEKIDSAKSENLIIDLRFNGGGSLEEIENLYSYLALKPFKFVNKAESKTGSTLTKSVFSKRDIGIFGNMYRILGTPGLFIYDLLYSKKENGKYYYKLTKTKLKKPKPNSFKGKIYVLINGFSFSAASIISTNLHATKRAFFVGEETGGHYNGTVAGQSKFVTLPNSKVRMKFGMWQIESPFKQEPNGYGIRPDVEIIPTHQDRIQNRDPELEWVLEAIYND